MCYIITMKDLQTRETASWKLKVSIRTIDRLIKQGKMKAVRIGSLVRIPQEEIDRIGLEGANL